MQKKYQYLSLGAASAATLAAGVSLGAIFFGSADNTQDATSTTPSPSETVEANRDRQYDDQPQIATIDIEGTTYAWTESSFDNYASCAAELDALKSEPLEKLEAKARLYSGTIGQETTLEKDILGMGPLYKRAYDMRLDLIEDFNAMSCTHIGADSDPVPVIDTAGNAVTVLGNTHKYKVGP